MRNERQLIANNEYNKKLCANNQAQLLSKLSQRLNITRNYAKMQAITNKPALVIDATIIICIDLKDTPCKKLRLQNSIGVN